MGRIAASLVAAARRSQFRNGMAGAGRGATWLRRRSVLVAPVFALAARLRVGRAIEKMGALDDRLAIGMSLGALGIEAYDTWRTSMNAPAMARLAAPPPAGREEGSYGGDGPAINESLAENSRMVHWKSAVEEALKDAAATQPTPRAASGEGAAGAEPTASSEMRPQDGKPRANQAAAKGQDPKAQEFS